MDSVTDYNLYVIDPALQSGYKLFLRVESAHQTPADESQNTPIQQEVQSFRKTHPCDVSYSFLRRAALTLQIGTFHLSVDG